MLTIPTRRDILRDFQKWVRQTGDEAFQFERAVRRWLACGYPVNELPAIFACTAERLAVAIQKAREDEHWQHKDRNH